jgi:TolB protein
VTPSRLVAGDHPDWSPDGRWILFRSNLKLDNRQSQIHLIHLDGSGLKQITHFKSGSLVLSSSFSPDADVDRVWSNGRRGERRSLRDAAGRKPKSAITHTRLGDSARDWGRAG